ncbi:hypothetical protein [Thalassolituus oleivorans]|nr:hypothetical protein [Thalassolituus oleivorans]
MSILHIRHTTTETLARDKFCGKLGSTITNIAQQQYLEHRHG